MADALTYKLETDPVFRAEAMKVKSVADLVALIRANPLSQAEYDAFTPKAKLAQDETAKSEGYLLQEMGYMNGTTTGLTGSAGLQISEQFRQYLPLILIAALIVLVIFKK